jgi:hypothetical protein
VSLLTDEDISNLCEENFSEPPYFFLQRNAKIVNQNGSRKIEQRKESLDIIGRVLSPILSASSNIINLYFEYLDLGSSLYERR